MNYSLLFRRHLPALTGLPIMLVGLYLCRKSGLEEQITASAAAVAFLGIGLCFGGAMKLAFLPTRVAIVVGIVVPSVLAAAAVLRLAALGYFSSPA